MDLLQIADVAMPFEALTSVRLDAPQSPFLQAISTGDFVTVTRAGMFADEPWETPPLNNLNGIGLHRVTTKPNFLPRDSPIVRTIFKQIDRLHRHGQHADSDLMIVGFAPRMSKVFILLLAGDSKKRIAHRLVVREHTVVNYVKQLYRHFFAVGSRGELQAHFQTSSGQTLVSQVNTRIGIHS